MKQFFKGSHSAKKMQWTVFLTLWPAAAWCVYAFGWNALLLMVSSVAASMAAEAAARKLFGKPFSFGDGQAVTSGLLIAFLAPPQAPWWLAAAGAAFGSFFGRECFGGTGQYPFNPAHLARALWITAWPAVLRASYGAGPRLLPGLPAELEGWYGMAETAWPAFVAGGWFLISKRVISWTVPFYFFGVISALSLAAGRDPLSDLLTGGAVAAGFYYLTDASSSPVSQIARIVFAAGTAALVMAFRVFLGEAQGVTQALLLMNLLALPLDAWFGPKARKRTGGVSAPRVPLGKNRLAVPAEPEALELAGNGASS